MSVGQYEAFATWSILDWSEKRVIACSFFHRSKQLCRAIKAQISVGTAIRFGYRMYTTKGQKYGAIYKPVSMKRDGFTLTTVYSQEINTRYIVTSVEDQYEDIYNFLMWNSKLPLLREWTEPIVDMLLDKGNIRRLYNAATEYGESVGIDLNGRVMRAGDIIVYDFNEVGDPILREVVSRLIEMGRISVANTPSKPLVFEDFNGYVTKYGPALVKSLDRVTQPLIPLKGDLDGFVAMNKRLYPQQAACVNGIIALKKAKSQYGLMVEGMGCGKTVQGAATVDAYFNQRWLENHPGRELKDIYLPETEDKPAYRNIVMAPSHLVAKWKEEIESEIPQATATIIKSLDQLLTIRSEGKERNGRQWYLISKDFAKLGAQTSPIPVNVAKKYPTGLICKDCYEEDGETYYAGLDKQGRRTCPKCGGHHFKRVPLLFRGEQRGLTCPDCGSLLMRYSAKWAEEDGEDHGDDYLGPKDFASHNSKNDTCFVCGAHLWGVDAKPILPAGITPKEKKWRKVSHWKNWQKKNRTTAWVLKGHEAEYYSGLNTDLSDVQYSKVEYGPRRFAPAQFIKKYLNGYFDFALLDEAHKYENGGTAQSIAAHALMKASSFTLALTGTISNGKADSLFYLLYMLDPRRMKKKGFEYTDVMSFSKIYGAVETCYESLGNEDGTRNTQSRGRQISAPRVKPGISPKLFTDFLLDKAVFLDLSDLSKYLPPLKEQVVTCDCPDEVAENYSMVLTNLKNALRQKGGRSLLSTMLQFGLSYPDKPYGRGPVMHPLYKDFMVSGVPACEDYQTGALLPKEEKLCEIVRQEIAEDRNVFVYCAYTGSGEMSVLERLKGLVEKHCNLAGQVLVMEASSPKAEEREQYIHKKASEGFKVIICNMKLVETGLDFCFNYEGEFYNYPSIVFYQLTYELSVMWQASRRHYRLNQKEECRTYYLTTDNTLQMAAVQVMAEKQVAASAIQGKFSADGLAAMANGVDPRIKLAQMLAENDNGDGRESIENMFDVMNASNAASDDESRYGDYVPPKTFWELMDGYLDRRATKAPVVVTTTKKEEPAPAKKKKAVAAVAELSIFDLMAGLEPVVVNAELLDAEKALASKSKKKAKRECEGQLDFLNMCA
jgi:hypothetical protein